MAADEAEQLRAEIERLRRALADAPYAPPASAPGEVGLLARHLLDNMQQGAAVLAADGAILFASRRFGEILQAPADDLTGESLYDRVDVANHETIKRLLAAGVPQDGEVIQPGASGGTVHAQLRVAPRPDGSRSAVLTDLTERVRVHEMLASREWLRVTLASIGDAVLSCDTKLKVTFINPIAERLTGWFESAALGQPIETVFRVVDEVTRQEGESAAARALSEETVVPLGSRAVLMTRDGREIPVEDSAAPIRDCDGRIVGAVLVFHDATERRRAHQMLLESEARLVGANRAKDYFLATLSHELRTPMNAILGWAQLLATRNLDEATRDRGLQAILRSAHAQARLVTDLLDVSRIVSGTLRLSMRAVDLTSVLFAALDSARPSAEARRISLTMSIDLVNAVIDGDADRLQQVVGNLLSNAVKFTPEGGMINVSLQQTGSGFLIRVRDNGAGIPREFLPRVFERFAQADPAGARQPSGLGLGLSIAWTIVDLHGGTLEALSDGEGRGATFTVRLPAHVEDPGRSKETSGLPAQDQPGLLAGLQVLVVDDDPDGCSLLGTIVTDYGARAGLATSPADALERLRQEKFDVILADIGLPGRDGYDFIRAVRRLPPDCGGSVPAAALTVQHELDAERTMASGFQVHVTKPVVPATLAATIAWLAGRSDAAGRKPVAQRSLQTS